MPQKKISILITAMREAAGIGPGLESLLAGFKGDFEVLYSIPDAETEAALLRKAADLGISSNLRKTTLDLGGKPHGKPKELNTLMDMAKGDIWILGDPGDCTFSPGCIDQLLKHFDDPKVMAVSGHPVSADKKDTMMGYFGNLLADAAHHKRNIELRGITSGTGTKFVQRHGFFPVSGYLFAMRKSDIRNPEDTLVEDAYVSYRIFNDGGKIEYEPEARVYVKYAKSLSDYFKQKKRSVGGYVQLWQYGVVRADTVSRSPKQEIQYFWFPLTYAQNLRQLFWSLMLYPIRAYLWLIIWWERKVLKKSFTRTWVQAESTKS